MKRRLHIHWRRPVGPVRGPFTLTTPALGVRRYRCRCGREWDREEAVREPRWREVR